MATKKSQTRKEGQKRSKTHVLTPDHKKHLVPVIVSVLKKAKGIKKSVTNNYIRKVVKHKTGIFCAQHEIRGMIHYIRINGLVPLLIASQNGYWITNNTAELLQYLGCLQNRIKQIGAIKGALKKQGARVLGRQKAVKRKVIRKK